MKSNYKKLGQYIRPVDVRNKNLSVDNLLGVSIEKKFIPSIANTVGTNFRNYKIVRTGQFAYGPVTSRNGEKISIALLTDDDCIISSSYNVFEIIDTSQLCPEYLMLWFSRPEFDRYARYNSWGSVREIFGWDDMCNVELPVPPVEEQRHIVEMYQTVTNRIELLEKINKNLEEQADVLYQGFLSPKVGSSGKTVTLDDFCSIFTGRKNANAAVPDGKYRFFTCAPDFLQINSYIYDGNAIIVSGNGAYTGRTRFYSGKFDLYQRTYACTLLKGINPDFIFPLYWFVKIELSKKIMGGTRGSAIPYIVMNDLAKFEFMYDEDIFLEYTPVFKGLTQAIQTNEFEGENLASIRDTLLPKLMSSGIDASDIDL